MSEMDLLRRIGKLTLALREIKSQETPGSNATVKRMAAIAKRALEQDK